MIYDNETKKSNIDKTIQIKHLEQALRSEGIRITQQRMAILAALVGSDDHPTVETLYRRANKLMSHVSLATVYRTVTVLVECGAVIKNEFEGSNTSFELANKPHHDHLIDIETGEVIEFVSDEIETMQEKIAKELGYEIVFHRLELYAKRRS